MSGAVVCLSGGQDSSTCLFYAVRRYHPVHAVSFNYGQRHRVELECAAALAARAGIEQVVLPVDALSQLAGGSLTNPAIESRLDAAGTGHAYAERRGLPSSFVPGRNIIFLGLAAAYGIPRGLETLVAGVCSTDEAGYPDCRPEFVESLEQTIRIGMDCPEFAIDAPLLHLTKAGTWTLAEELGVVELIRTETHTCYEGERGALHAWGYGCGSCPACATRARGWAEYAALTKG
ncbi:MAG TPA: 7-cyano-7-deazaguanine synthase QueC [Gaiellales bacterium]|nr:7-cyano-7-deazaguanine synthase QueC [Gaiellales bacterium]